MPAELHLFIPFRKLSHEKRCKNILQKKDSTNTIHFLDCKNFNFGISNKLNAKFFED